MNIYSHSPFRNPNRRYMLVNIWSFGIEKESFADFKTFVDAARDARFDIVRYNLHWHHLEPFPDQYDFSKYDDRIAYIVDQGMAVGINLDVRVVDRALLVPPAGLARQADGHLFKDGESHMLSFVHKASMDRACAAVAAVAGRYATRVGERLAFLQVTNSPCCEIEYWHGALLDYGDPASYGWRNWLTQTYGQMGDINAALGTSFETVKAANPPLTHDGAYGRAWYRYRSSLLQAAIDRFALTIRQAAPNADYSIQWGSVWDGAAARRGTILFPALARAANWVTVDDAPSYDHCFSSDLLRSNCQPGQILGNEIDHPDMADDATYLGFAQQAYDHGLNLMSVANWSPATLRARSPTLFHPMAELRDQPVTQISPDAPSMTILASELLECGPDQSLARYRLESNEGQTSIHVKLNDDLV